MSKRNKNKMSKKHQQQGQQDGGAIVRQLREIPNGIMSCVLAHRTASSTSDFTWGGGTLNEIWPQILAFFRWTNDTMHSESQVRLFINVQTKQWKAWAFPQKARTGMTAHELTSEDQGYELTLEQRAQFPDELWHYWGTVHHHCNGSAFQSGTDTNNEVGQDGIHITVGNLGSPRYSIHFRLYVGRFHLNTVSIAQFWDIGDAIDQLPPKIKQLLQSNAEEEIAKYQMCEPPPADQEFPEVWKTNVIDTTPVRPVSAPVPFNNGGSQSTLALSSQATVAHVRPYSMRAKGNFEWDMRKATASLIELVRHPHSGLKDIETVYDLIVTLAQGLDEEMLDILDVLSRHDVTPISIVSFLDKQIKEARAKELEAALAQHEVEGGKQQHQQQQHGQATKAEILGAQTNHGVELPPHHWSEGMC